jgi:hypothetical protein
MIGALSVFAADGPVSGVWKISGKVADNAVEMTCKIKQADKKLTGSCKNTNDGTEYSLTGEVNETNVQWKYTRDFNGTEITSTYKGTLDDKSMTITGKFNVQPFDIDGDFNAKKEDAK